MILAGKNLRYLRKLRGWTQEEFAARLNIKRSLLGAYEEDRAKPNVEVLQQISSIFKVSFEDILMKDLAEEKTASYMQKRRNLKLSREVSTIHFVPVKAAAGYLNGFADPEFIDELNTFTLPMLLPGNYRAFEIVGDSMLPTPSGSVIVGEKVEHLNSIKPSHTYIVISKNDGVVYKRIDAGRSATKLTLISDNPAYKPYTVSSDDIVELWKTALIISKPAVQPRWDVDQLVGLVSSMQQELTAIKKKVKK